ncbi:MAG: potassium channel family protein [Burkholderiaceae bacterium]
MPFKPSTLFHGDAARGLRRAPGDAAHPRLVEQRWRWPVVLALAGTVPAFYLELLRAATPWLAPAAYLLAALTVALALLHAGWRGHRLPHHLRSNLLDLALVLGLLLAAVLPPSSGSAAALTFRLVVALITLLRMVWALSALLTRGGLVYLLLAAAVVLGLCGVGFWWLEPKALTLGDGLWLAFTTAATVGYGDLVPSTPASKIFSVFVVMLGFGVLSLVTAAIATRWIETEERIIEREILRDMHRQMAALSQEIVSLRRDVTQARDTAVGPAPSAQTD